MDGGVGLLVVLAFSSCCQYCTAAEAASAIACEAVQDDAPGPSCLPVNESEPSCNGNFEYSKKMTDCFGYINNPLDLQYPVENGLRVEPFYLKNFTQTGKVGYCPRDPSIQSGSCVPFIREYNVDNLNVTHSFFPINLQYYNLFIKFNSPDLDPVEAYGIFITYTGNLLGDCVCINSSYTHEFNLTLAYMPNTKNVRINISVNTFPRMLSRRYEILNIVPPRHCADYEHNIPYDAHTCGLPRYEKPRNVTFQCNATHVNISWAKPHYKEPGTGTDRDPDIDAYYLTITTCDEHDKHYFIIRNTTEVIINTSRNFDFVLYAYSECSGFFEYQLKQAGNVGCSQPTECSNEDQETSCCVVLRSPTPTVSTPSSPTPTHVYLVPACASAGIVVILITAVIVIVCLIFYRKSRPRPTGIHLAYCRVQKSPSPYEYSVLIIYSPSTPEKEERVILQSLGPHLLERGIRSAIPVLRQPKQTLIDWISEHYEKADAVFCVCNEEFSRDWNDSSASPHNNDNSVAVRTLKQLFEGDLHVRKGRASLSRYAVLLTKHNDETLIPPLLRTQPRFDISDTPALAEFAVKNVSRV